MPKLDFIPQAAWRMAASPFLIAAAAGLLALAFVTVIGLCLGYMLYALISARKAPAIIWSKLCAWEE